jgi:hypothetical protein
MNRNSKRRAKAELKIRRQAGEKLVNPKSKRRTAWWGGISKRVPVKSLYGSPRSPRVGERTEQLPCNLVP